MVYKIADLAGMPKWVLVAYEAILENMTTYNTIAGGLGHSHQRKVGIPQGCPFSMMIVALLLRPWLLMAKTMGAVPKVLVDDVLIIAKGACMVRVYTKTLNATHQYLQDLGARMAPTKKLQLLELKHSENMAKGDMVASHQCEYRHSG